MRNYIEINGVSSLTLVGFAINTLPPISKPPMRNLIEEIDGRDGDIITKLGYGAYDKQIEVGLYGESYDINEIIAFFNSEGEITFSNEPDKIYNFTILDQIDFEKLVKFKTAVITLHCQPFKYKKDEEPIEIEYQYVEGEGTEITLNNTDNQPLKMELFGNTSQTGTPTPTSPIPVNVVSGDNEIVVCGKNLFNKNTVLRNKTFTSQDVVSDSTGLFVSDYIRVKPNTDYYVNENASVVIGLDKNKTSLGYIRNTSSAGTFTTGATCEYVRIRSHSTTIPMETAISNAMLSLGTTAPTTYEPYQGNTYNIDLPMGINLYDFMNNTYNNEGNLTITKLSNGFILTNNSSNLGRIIFSNATVDSSKNYVISFEIDNPSGKLARLGWSGSSKTVETSATSGKITGVLTGITTSVFSIYIDGNSTITITNLMYYEGTNTSKSYEPYGITPIELCKIGTYQDYFYKDSDKWYLHKEIGKVVYTGDNSEGWTGPNSVTTPTNRTTVAGGYGYIKYSNNNYLSNYFIKDSTTSNRIVLTSSGASSVVYMSLEDSLTGIASGDSEATKLQKIKTWLGTNNVPVYYVYATPTNTEITYEPLIEQLDAILEAVARKGQTNISQINNDLPFYIKASTREEGSDTATIDNEGNIFSKPILELSGSGTIGVSLNGNQLFNVDLSDPNAIVIDPNQLEAYNPSNLNLMNRKVEGDIDNLKLPEGENTLKVSGNLNKATITKYERWL